MRSCITRKDVYKRQLLELYNALNGTKYGNPEELEIMTWDDVLYMRMKNDVSMLIDGRLNLYEHQSSWNPNMPLRGLIYFAELYKDLTREKNIYGPKLIPLPTPIYIEMCIRDRHYTTNTKLVKYLAKDCNQ